MVDSKANEDRDVQVRVLAAQPEERRVASWTHVYGRTGTTVTSSRTGVRTAGLGEK